MRRHFHNPSNCMTKKEFNIQDLITLQKTVETMISNITLQIIKANPVLKKHKGEPREIVTDKLRSYGVAHRELIPETIHNMEKYANNRAELSHQPTRVRERGMRRFKSMKQAQRFIDVHAAVYNLFNLGRHLVSAETYRYFRLRSFASWKNAAMV